MYYLIIFQIHKFVKSFFRDRACGAFFVKNSPNATCYMVPALIANDKTEDQETIYYIKASLLASGTSEPILGSS